jgi:hypothetical protein
MKVDSTTLIIGVVGIAAVYLLTRPKTVTPTYLPTTVNPALSSVPNYAGNETAQDISAGATALTALGNTLGNFF